MPSQKFELSDISGERYTSDQNLTMTSGGGKRSGCFISSVVGVLLAILVIILAVAVGLIVHFTANNKDFVCNCGATGSITDGAKPTASAIVQQQCEELAEDGNADICNKCPSTATDTTQVATTTPATTNPPMVTDVRLPTDLEPLHYDVTIQPYMHHTDPKDFTFKGSVKVFVKCLNATDKVTLHSNVLTVKEASIKFKAVTPGNNDPLYVSWSEDKERQFFIIKLDKNMQVGQEYMVSMDFTSPLKDDLAGLYYSSYKLNNKTIYLATTQFQPTDARKTFPCMDEPALKATFNITLIRPSSLKSFSNTPIIDSSTTKTENSMTYTADVYAKTPKMSTYLLAFVICDFDYTESTTPNNVKYRAIARQNAINSTRYALEVGVEVLTYFEEYFETPYPLPKQDMMAVPDFSAGAMENWGLIIYRETAMLYKPGVSNERNKARVAVVVAHELAHMWFGDLVTPSWWDDLWLNEGFATFVQYLGVDYKHKDWKMFETFVLAELQSVFNSDGLVTSHPVYVPVSHPDEIDEIFDGISYSKGASIIRMMRHFLGYETFRKGLVNYLQEFKYGAAFHDDLWRALTNQSKFDGSNLDVKEIMDTWTLQMNYPVVTVTRDYNKPGMLSVRQERYLQDSTATDPMKYVSPYNYKWNIPLTFTSSKELNFDETAVQIHWLKKEEEQRSFDFGTDKLGSSSDDWILANVQQNGFYRVNYQQGNWEALANQLKKDHTVIPVINRAQIINDAWNLAGSGHLPLKTALMVIEYLKNEMDYIPLSAASSELGYVRSMLSLTSVYGGFKNFLGNTVQGAYSQFGLNLAGSSNTELYFRVLVAGIACGNGNENCKAETSKLYKEWMDNEDTNPIDPNLKSLVYCNAVSNGGWDEWQFALKKYQNEIDASEKARLLSALSCSSQPWILNNFLNMLLVDDSLIRKQDGLSVIRGVSSGTVGRPLAWNFYKAHYDTLKEHFGSSSWRGVIRTVTGSFNTQYELEEIKVFMKSIEGSLGTGKRAFEQAIERTQSNIKWMENNFDTVKEWLQSNDGATTEPTTPAKVTDVRLPTDLKPLHYDVTIQPYMHHTDPKDFTFKGSVRALVRCINATDTVTLHINVLTVKEASIKFKAVPSGNNDPVFVSWREDKERQFFIIKLDKNMQVGQEYMVSMDFTSPLKDDLKGLYYSSYKRDNKTIYLATTQFQPTDARKTFPCMDEPALKATFNITLIRPSNLKSFSNTPIIDSSTTKTENGIEYTSDVYAKTPIMSTYLLALVVCDFEYTNATTSNGIEYRAIARPNAKDSTHYALDVGVEVLTYFEEYFETPYPLPKQDMIAVPDFSAGAMENWGLIIYRETAMLYKPGVSNERNKERVAVVVAHELAHMWFGDLVTPSWWDDLWLNEGFASFVEYLGVDYKHKDWKMFESFVLNDLQNVFNFDGLVTSHPVYVPVGHPDEINEIFDVISYAKGASIIRMMRHFLGYETFRKGVVNYLQEFKYGAAFHDDLWRALTNQSKFDGSNLDVKEIMDTWTLQMNYPVVMVTRDFSNPGILNVQQERYLKDSTATDPMKYVSPYNYKWNIPLTFTSSKELNFNETAVKVHWLKKEEEQKSFDFGADKLGSSSDDWILANIQQNGFYRVNYQQDNWEALANQLKTDHTVISVINRAQIINDAWSLAGSGHLPLKTALMVIEYLKNEMDYIPMSAANYELGYVQSMLSLTSVYGGFKNFLGNTVQGAYSQFGLDLAGSSHKESYFRVLVAGIACGNGNENCKAETSKLYKEWMDNEDTNPIDPNLKSLVYCNAVSNGGWDEWQFALKKYQNEIDASEKARLLSALSCSSQPWILNNFLDMLLVDDSLIRKQDALSVINYVSSETVGRPLAWNFFKAHYDTLSNQFGGSSFSWSRVIGTVTKSFNTQYELEEIKLFMKNKEGSLGSGKRAFEQAIEKTQSNIKWMENNFDTVKEWLKSNDGATTTPAKVTDVRLPTDLKPLHYDVTIQPYMHHTDPKDFTFKGSVRAFVRCINATDTVTLHINVLTVREASIKFSAVPSGTNDPVFVSWREDKERQFFLIKLNKNMQVGQEYMVSMDFTSPLKDDLKGLYYSSYKRDNKTIYLATTQFQPTDARKTFPCMDEPALKATFNITLIRPSSLKSFSNTPIIDSSTTKTENGIEYTSDVYAKTPIMSTYLLAFVVCDFEYTNATTSNGIEYRAIARPNAKDATHYALDIGVDVLTYFEEYFETPYPLPKQDMMAVPDFAAGAMENWGLIIYRETAMLYKPGVSNERNKERVAVVVAHELAHQWFGDLVTPSWWDDLWLNEGFASFVEYLGVDFKHKDWKMFESFVLDDLQDVFNFDGLVSSHPVYVPVGHPDEINEIFDRISYAKGASIIRMMRHFLGYETFRKGLVNYLQELKYGAAFHDDLWRALTNQSKFEGFNLNVKDIMDTWTLQMNYPVVMVTRDPNNLASLHVKQARYLKDKTATDPKKFVSPFDYKWTIPLTFTSSKDLNFNETAVQIHWLKKEEEQKSFNFGLNKLGNGPDDWILANVQQNGFYRVNYNESNWEALAKQLESDHTVIPVINRAQIINDAWNLAGSGDLPLKTALRVIEYLKNEMDYIPLSAADRELGFVRSMLSLTSVYGGFKKFMGVTVNGAYNKLGLNLAGASHKQTYFRVLVAGIACGNGNENCTAETSKQYKQWMDNESTNPIDPNLKSLVYCNAVGNGGWDEWQFALKKYMNEIDASEQARLLSALTCSGQPWILNNLLNMLLEENSLIRKQDALTVINYVSSGTIGRPLAWNFFKAHYDTLKEQFGNSFFAWTRLIGRVTSSFNTPYELEEIKLFMKSKEGSLGTGERAFEQAIEKTQSNINWMKNNFGIIETWLQDNNYVEKS